MKYLIARNRIPDIFFMLKKSEDKKKYTFYYILWYKKIL